MIYHWSGIDHLFAATPGFGAIAALPWNEQLAKLKEPAVRTQIVAEAKAMGLDSKTPFPLDRIYEMAEYPNYEPDPARGSIAARAALAGEEPLAYAYDVMMRNDGGGMIHVPLANYTAGHFDEVRKILSHPGTRVSLADGGAHLTRVADAATPTFMLMHWARDRSRGEKRPSNSLFAA